MTGSTVLLLKCSDARILLCFMLPSPEEGPFGQRRPVTAPVDMPTPLPVHYTFLYERKCARTPTLLLLLVHTGPHRSLPLCVCHPALLPCAAGMNRPKAKLIKGQEPEPEVVVPKPKKVRTASQRKRLEHQDPLHDHDADACASLGDDEHQIKSFQLLNDKRNEMYGVGKEKEAADDDGDDTFKYAGCNCQKCAVPFVKGDAVIEAELTSGPIVRHEKCFCCFNCDEQLEEHKFYEFEDEVYCGRCHAEMFMPRCAGCDELIFDPTYTVAEGKKWHLVHFCCWVCDTDLCEKQYAKDPEDNPVCLPCYNDKYAVTCATCKEPITAGEKAMRAGDMSYHHTEECFKCKVCTTPLENKKCVQYQDDIYCTDCYQNVHSPPCGRCNERINGEYVEVRGKRYMKSCFTCFECDAPFTREEKKGAYPIGDRLLCYDHAKAEKKKELAAKRAAKADEERVAKEKQLEEEEEAKRKSAAALEAELASDNAAEAADVVAEPEGEDISEPIAMEAVKEKEGGIAKVGTKSMQSFVRKGTRQVTRIKKAPKGSVKPTAAEKDKMLAAVRKAEQEAAEQSQDDILEDDDEQQGDAANTATAEAEVPKDAAKEEPKEEPAATVPEAIAEVPEPSTPVQDVAKDLGAALAVAATEPATSNLVPSASDRSKAAAEADPFAALWAGFSIPMKYAKFSLDKPGREILDIGAFHIITKKATKKAYLVLCTDVAFLAQMVDEDCYEMMYMPVERPKVKAKLAKMQGTANRLLTARTHQCIRCKEYGTSRSTAQGSIHELHSIVMIDFTDPCSLFPTNVCRRLCNEGEGWQECRSQGCGRSRTIAMDRQA